GAKWILKSSSPPRQILVAFTEPNSPAGVANLARGAEVITADGVDVVNGTDVDTLNAAFFPETTGETHTFEVRDLGSSTVRTISMTSASITKDPVQNVEVLSTDSGFVGYLTFNDHIATAEAELVNAIESLRDSNIEDLILDLRYNGGGYLDIANELAYMIAGPNATSGRTFESQQFNDKHPSVNPVTGASLVPRSFHNQAQGFSVDRGVLLPYLDLSRVYVLTSGNTCSASEAIINGLRGIDVEVIQIGTTTCGKPYGFYEMANCGTSYFSIQFKGVNAKGYGDYSDGFSPSNLATIEGEPVPGCAVADDFGNPLGNSNEAMLKAALAYRANPGNCPALPASGNQEPLLGYEGLRPSAVGVISEPRFPGRLVRQPTVQ
ncbi:MAG: S41 family peptidase, partial [Pseudomonadota bacterium]|nr:S41 family peptidase [Pseudomonadota bacterium]